MSMPDNIFEQALERLRSGESITAISASFPEHSDELAALLPIARLTMEIPKLEPPIPQKHFRFKKDLETLPYRFANLFDFFRLAAIPISLVIVFFTGKVAVQAAQNSLPGERLYSLKRAGEEARLTLSFSESNTASIHLELSQKRLNDVKKAIDSQNPGAETAALAALQQQTEKTFAVVPNVAALNAVANQDSSLLNVLVAINKEQKSLLATLKDDGQNNDKEATKTALNTSKDNDKTIAKLIATVNDQTLIDLPNRISITGMVSAYKDSKVTVEKNVFIINDETIITDSAGEHIALLPKDVTNVTVIGSNVAEGLFAKTITIVEDNSGVPTTVSPNPTSQPKVNGAIIKPTGSKPTPKPTTTPVPTPDVSTTQVPPAPTNQATGTFITEPSAEQYAP